MMQRKAGETVIGKQRVGARKQWRGMNKAALIKGVKEPIGT